MPVSSNLFARKKWLRTGLMLLIILSAAWLRFWRLAELPPGFYYDEAYNALDGLWIVKTLTPTAYFVSNTGRHPMIGYLAGIAMTGWGLTPYAARLAAPMVNVLFIALMYPFVLLLFADRRDRYWLALIAAASMAFSMWHVVMSRTVYESSLLPFFVVLTATLFWQGCRRRSMASFAAAGIALGLAQYTYFASRLLPLIFGLFVLAWTIIAARATPTDRFRATRRSLWQGLLVMALLSFVVFIPLGLFILNDPVTFFFRSGDVFILNRAARGEASAVGQLVNALRVFIDTSSDTWRHNIVGQSGFNGLNLLGFGVGLATIIVRIRKPAHLFLLIGLVITWIPAPLSSGISTLRISAMLPFYYVIMALGLVTLITWITQRWLKSSPNFAVQAGLLALIFIISGGGTAYGYFWRWANEPAVYEAYHGHFVDLAQRVIDESQGKDVLLPFYLYEHPSVRFMLFDDFKEVSEPPPVTADRGVVLVREPEQQPSAMVWLTRDASGQGLAYVMRPQPPDVFSTLTPTGPAVELRNPADTDTIALFTPYESLKPLSAQLTDWPSTAHVDYNFGDEVRLSGYEIWPSVVQPGQSPVLNLYWQSLVGQPYPRTQFVQLIDRHGNPIAQWTDSSLYDEHRWRPGGVIPDQHIIWLGADAEPGPYLVRVGLFDYSTNKRVPVRDGKGVPVEGNQVVLGLFYVTGDGVDPRTPQIPLQAKLGNKIELLGYALSPLEAGASTLRVRLHWRAIDPVAEGYTAFVQLLDSEGNRVTGWDSQPLAGQYPTSSWQPREIVIDAFDLPLPETLAPGTYHLITGLYSFETGQRLSVTSEDRSQVMDDAVILQEFSLGAELRKGS
ncbi:MAG: phospholipid carrier-dependent glycosyltransferase [Anaerolineae bacterium]|nr:phospholipid carrier-dependent glycosyltransferase [Anaerolineae bacterium]